MTLALLRILVFFAVLLLPAIARATPLATHYRDGDAGDWSLAFRRAQEACLALGGAPYVGAPGCQVELADRDYPIAQPIDICIPLRVTGVGLGAVRWSSRITTRKTSAFRIWQKGKCPWPSGNAGALHLERATLTQAGGQSVEGGAPFYGIEARGHFALFDVGIVNFVSGVRAHCDAKNEGSNCNGSMMRSVGIDLSEHAGVVVEGADANAGYFEAVRSDRNCRLPDRWIPGAEERWCPKYPTHAACTDRHFRCAGIVDRSFLGNTWMAPHTATENGFAGIIAIGANNYSTILGAYLEDDTLTSLCDSRVTVHGGASGPGRFVGCSGQIHGPVLMGATLLNGDLRLDLGSQTAMPGVMWTVGNAATGPHPWRMKLDKSGNMFLDVGNLAPMRGFLPWKVTP